jgi:hypothetical protein
MLDELVFLVQRHVAHIMMEVSLSADVAGLSTAVAGLHEGFESWGAVDVHRNAGGSVREGVCIAAGVAALEGGCDRRKEKGERGGTE